MGGMGLVTMSGNGDGTWKSKLCDCCSDVSTCLVACCCAPIAVGQLWDRVMLKGSCIFIVIAFVILQMIIYSIKPSKCADNDKMCSEYGEREAAEGLVEFLIIYMLIMLRRAVRKRDNIPEGASGSCCSTCGSCCTRCACCCPEGCEDCCEAFWCPCCLIAQLLRHNGLQGRNYNLLTPDGETDLQVLDGGIVTVEVKPVQNEQPAVSEVRQVQGISAED